MYVDPTAKYFYKLNGDHLTWINPKNILLLNKN